MCEIYEANGMWSNIIKPITPKDKEFKKIMNKIIIRVYKLPKIQN